MQSPSKKQIVHIVTGGDSHFFPGIQVALVSSLLFLQSEDDVWVHVLDGGLNDIHQEKIRNACLSVISRCKVIFHIIDQKSFATLSSGPNGSRMFYARLAIPEILHDANKAIYIDADTVVLGDLMNLWNRDLNDNFALACNDRKIHRLSEDCPWQLSNEEFNLPYFNTGLMVLNLKKWREEGIFSSAQEASAKVGGHLKFWDQTLLNYVLRGQVDFLPQEWNWQNEQLPENKIPLGMIHFTAKKKPWLYYGWDERHRIWRYLYKLQGESVWRLFAGFKFTRFLIGSWDACVESNKVCRKAHLMILKLKKKINQNSTKRNLIEKEECYWINANYSKLNTNFYIERIKKITKLKEF